MNPEMTVPRPPLTDEPGKITRISPNVAVLEGGSGRNPLIPEAWVFTFGMGHPLARRYVQLTGSEAHCRELMSEIFGRGRWAGIYREDVAGRVIDRGRLTLLDLGLNHAADA